MPEFGIGYRSVQDAMGGQPDPGAVGRGMQRGMNMRQQFMQMKQQQQRNKLMGPALAGDPDAMMQLQSSDPEAFMMVQDRQMAQAAAAEEARVSNLARMDEYFEETNEMLRNARARGATPQELLDLANRRQMYGVQEFKDPYQQMVEGLSLRQRELMTAPPERDIRTVGGALVEVQPTGETEVLYEEEQDPGMFEGTGLHAQAMNEILKGVPAKQRPLAKAEISKRYLSQPKTMTTEQGTITYPGLDVSGLTTAPPEQTEAVTGEKLTPRQEQTQRVLSGGVIPGTEKTSPLQRSYNEEFTTLENFGKILNRYEKTLNELGPQMAIGPLNAEDQQALNSDYKALQLEIKNLAELGVLAGPDMGLIEGWVSDPTTLMGLIKGKDTAQAGVNSLKNYMTNKRSTFNSKYEGLNVKTRDFSDLPRDVVIPDHPTLGRVTETEIKAAMDKYGKTREEVMQIIQGPQ